MPLPPRRPVPGKPADGRYQKLLFDGQQCFEAKNYEAAFTVYAQALKLAPPGDERALAQLCRCYRKKARKALNGDNHPEVIRLLQEMQALERVGKHLKALDFKVLAESALETENLALAQQALAEALQRTDVPTPELQRLQQRVKAEALSRELKGLH